MPPIQAAWAEAVAQEPPPRRPHAGSQDSSRTSLEWVASPLLRLTPRNVCRDFKKLLHQQLVMELIGSSPLRHPWLEERGQPLSSRPSVGKPVVITSETLSKGSSYNSTPLDLFIAQD